MNTKFTKPAAILAAAILAVQYLPGLIQKSFVDATTTDNEIIDAIITGYEEDADDPGKFRVITNSDVMTQAVPDASGLIHNSRFDNCIRLNGIDVSKYQESINWNAVAADGIDFTILRTGYRGYDGGKIVKDYMFDSHIQGALNAGLSVGVYFFTQAITEKEAIEEAQYVINMIKDYDITLPVYFDVEPTEGAGVNGRLNTAKLSIAQRTAIAEAFCKTIEEAGYDAGVYSSKNYLLNYLDPDYLSTKYKIWLANYVNQTSYKGDYHMWQYTASGKVNGIPGAVDMNVLYSEKVNFSNDSVRIDNPETIIQPELTGDGIVTFESSNLAVATVDAVGNISGVSNGTAVITVFSSNGSRDTINVTVDFPPAAVLNYSGLLFSQIGATEIISRSGVQLTSSDSNVVTVSEDGTASAVGRGTAEITASDDQGNTAVCNVLVTDSEPRKGDCNLDGNINAIDAVFILNLAANLAVGNAEDVNFSDAYLSLYDFNSDGVINSFDASDLLVYSAYTGVGYKTK